MDSSDAPTNSSTINATALFTRATAVPAAILAGGVILHALNVYMILSLLPSAVKDIGGMRYYSWNETTFITASIIGSALSVNLMRKAGPSATYATAGGIFGVGSCLCAMAPDMMTLLCGRFIQGYGSGMLVSLAYMVIRMIFPETLWARAMGALSSMWAIATLIGPTLGGIFANLGLWRLSFWIVALFSVIFSLVALIVLPGAGSTRKYQTGTGLKQLMTLVFSVLVFSTTSSLPSLSENIVGIFSGFLVFSLFVYFEMKSETRILPINALQPFSSLMTFYALMAVLSLTVEAIEIFAPLFLQILHNQTPLQAGYTAVLIAAGWSAGSIASAANKTRFVGRIMWIAPIVEIAVLVFLAWKLSSPSDGALRDIMPIAMGFFLVGLVVGCSWPHLLSAIVRLTPKHEQEIASGSLTTIQLYTTAVAAAVAGTIANAAGLASTTGVSGAAAAAFWIFVIFIIVPASGVPLGIRAQRDILNLSGYKKRF